MKQKLSIIASALLILLYSCNSNDKKKEAEMKEPKLKEENISYTINDTLKMDGYVVYDENIEGKRPAVLVVHEWWGLNDYAKSRAKQLAELGYIAMAVDMYGNGKRADNPQDAGMLSTPFYEDAQMAKSRFDAALEKFKTYSQVDQSKIGAIGYCFGGGLLLNFARMGENLNGVVSFHGGLVSGVPANKDLLKAKILVCHGNADPFVPPTEVAEFKKQMDSISADYKFVGYDNATHAFSNPEATALGQKHKIPIEYNAAADTASWKEMKKFFGELFK